MLGAMFHSTQRTMHSEIIKLLGGHQVFGKTGRHLDLLEEIEKGLPVRAYEALAELLGLRPEEQDELLQVSLRTRDGRSAPGSIPQLPTGSCASPEPSPSPRSCWKTARQLLSTRPVSRCSLGARVGKTDALLFQRRLHSPRIGHKLPAVMSSNQPNLHHSPTGTTSGPLTEIPAGSPPPPKHTKLLRCTREAATLIYVTPPGPLLTNCRRRL